MGKSSTQQRRRRANDVVGDNKKKKAKRNHKTAMDSGNSREETDQRRRLPLSEVVSDCVERWFEDTLKEAMEGDINMQVLVGQMYYSGYGVPKDADKGEFWIARASRRRPSAWKVIEKRPGYNVSDSDSDSDELCRDS